jgi:hypothetical protein
MSEINFVNDKKFISLLHSTVKGLLDKECSKEIKDYLKYFMVSFSSLFYNLHKDYNYMKQILLKKLPLKEFLFFFFDEKKTIKKDYCDYCKNLQNSLLVEKISVNNNNSNNNGFLCDCFILKKKKCLDCFCESIYHDDIYNRIIIKKNNFIFKCSTCDINHSKNNEIDISKLEFLTETNIDSLEEFQLILDNIKDFDAMNIDLDIPSPQSHIIDQSILLQHQFQEQEQQQQEQQIKQEQYLPLINSPTKHSSFESHYQHESTQLNPIVKEEENNPLLHYIQSINTDDIKPDVKDTQLLDDNNSKILSSIKNDTRECLKLLRNYFYKDYTKFLETANKIPIDKTYNPPTPPTPPILKYEDSYSPCPPLTKEGFFVSKKRTRVKNEKKEEEEEEDEDEEEEKEDEDEEDERKKKRIKYEITDKEFKNELIEDLKQELMKIKPQSKRQNICSNCGAFGHNKRRHEKKK